MIGDWILTRLVVWAVAAVAGTKQPEAYDAAATDGLPPPVASDLREANRAYVTRLLHESYDALPAAERAQWPGDLSRALDDMAAGVLSGVWSHHSDSLVTDVRAAYDAGCRYPFVLSARWATQVQREAWFQRLKAMRTAYEQAVAEGAKWNTAMRLYLAARWRGICETMEQTNKEWRDLCGDDGTEVKASKEAADAALNVELIRFLNETPPSADELGAAWEFISYCVKRFDLDAIRSQVQNLNDWLSCMIEAEDLILRAWDARGRGCADTVTAEGWRIYGEEMAKVKKLCRAATVLRPDLPHPCATACAASFGDHATGRAWWERARAIDPNYLNPSDFMLWSLRPRWGGSPLEMVKLLARLLADPPDTLRPVYALEHLRNDVFKDEGGRGLTYKTYDEWLDANRAALLPILRAASTNGLTSVERAHVEEVLADAAWRLADRAEFERWHDMAATEPFRLSAFTRERLRYDDYLPVIAGTPEERKAEVMRICSRMTREGGPSAVARDAFLAVALPMELAGAFSASGQDKTSRMVRDMAANCISSRLATDGQVDILPFLALFERPMRVPKRGDGIVLRLKVRSGDPSRGGITAYFGWLKFRSEGGKALQSDVRVEGHRGFAKNQFRAFSWPREKESVELEIEVVGTNCTVRADGEVQMQRKLANPVTIFDATSVSIRPSNGAVVEAASLELVKKEKEEE